MAGRAAARHSAPMKTSLKPDVRSGWLQLFLAIRSGLERPGRHGQRRKIHQPQARREGHGS